MRLGTSRRRMAAVAFIGPAAATATLLFGGVAGAAPGDPAPGAPHFYNGNVSQIRDSGSDTTIFLMQKIADMYTTAGLYGCTLNSGSGQTLYNSSDPASSSANQQDYCQAGANVDTTDVNDNWDRTEVAGGVDDVGSGAGQNQLCGAVNSPLPVDFARSSKPIGSPPACATEAETGFAKDAVPGVDFVGVNPSVWGAVPSGSPYAGINGGVVGPVADGWEPGDPVGGPYSGTAFTNVSNADNGGGAASTAYRIWCATDSTRITDWGQLTNLSAAANGGTAQPVGSGAPIGIPIRVQGVNTGSGTEATWASYAESGVSGGGCSSNMNANAANDPNPATAPSPNSAHIALENNGAQIEQFAAGDFPGDAADQAVELSTTLYFESNGVFNTNPYAGESTVTNGSTSITYAMSKMNQNGKSTTTPNLLNNLYPTARTLFNIYRTDTVRASTAGFLNWICDSNTAFSKGVDDNNGKNYDAELSNLINTSFGFIRLTDTSAPASVATPADNQPAPNTTCAAGVTGSGAGNGVPAITTVAFPNT